MLRYKDETIGIGHVDLSDVNTKIEELNSSLKWKLVGSATGTTEISINTNLYSEFLIVVRLNGNADKMTALINSAELDGTAFAIMCTGGFAETNLGLFAQTYYNGSTIRLSSVRVNGNDSLSASTLKIYAR